MECAIVMFGTTVVLRVACNAFFGFHKASVQSLVTIEVWCVHGSSAMSSQPKG